MDPSAELQFGPFRLLGRNGPLLRAGKEISLQPKTLALLWVLLRNAGTVVTKNALLDAVWPGVIVGDAALTFQVQALRKAFGDEDYIATVHRVGFRFVGPTPQRAELPERAPAPVSRFVGREAELARLDARFAGLAARDRRLLFVTGEAGIGKSALIDAFVRRITERDPQVRVARGHCIEQSDAGEPFLPILEALGGLVRDSRENSTLEILGRLAPNWLLQMPSLLQPEELEPLRQRTIGSQPQQMLRELVEALEMLAAETPLVLIIEDIHWADSATLDVLNLIALRRQKARLMILCSMRVVDAILAAHPARKLQLSLQSRQMAEELSLASLDGAEIRSYLAGRFGDDHISDPMLVALQARSSGHPMFLHLIAAHLDGGSGSLEERVHRLGEELPRTLLDVVELQLQRLDAEEQAVLAAAAAAGPDFAAAGVAAACQMKDEAAERVLESLAGRDQFVEASGLSIWPDGTTSGRYRFRHALYAQVLRGRTPAARKSRMHLQIAERLETAFRERSNEIAAELAFHFEQGGSRAQALRYRVRSMQVAFDRLAPAEVRQEGQRALELLDALPEGHERDLCELRIKLILMRALLAEQGHLSPALDSLMERALPLVDRADDAQLLGSVLALICDVSHARGDFERARAIEKRITDIGERRGLPELEVYGAAWAAMTCCLTGQHRESDRQSAWALRKSSGIPLESAVVRQLHPVCFAITARAINRWYLGFPDQALSLAQEALDCIRQKGSLYWECLCRSSTYGTVLELRRDWNALLPWARHAYALSEQHGYSDGMSWARRQIAVAECMLGHTDEWLPVLLDIIATQRKIGILIGIPLSITLASECLIRLGRLPEAREALETGAQIAEERGLVLWQPELLRMQGELLLAEDGRRHAGEARARFERALELATQRRALSLQLRAATSLAALMADHAEAGPALELLEPLLARFTEGRATAELQQAEALLQRLRGQG